MSLLQILFFLPLLEIIGFIEIGPRIGLGLSLLWVVADFLAGFALLFTILGPVMAQAKPSDDAAAQHPLEQMFDGLCITVGALLLIFPGFISDFLAVPLLVPQSRRWLYTKIREQNQNLFHDINKSSENFTTWYYEERSSSGIKTIEGVFTQAEPPKKDDDSRQIK